MKRFLTNLAGIAALLVLLNQPSFAQDKEKDKEVKAKSKSKGDEIIIHRKTDKDAKVTIEIKGDEVLVNGKSVDDYEDENISIHKRQGGYTAVISPRTPFRAQGGTWSFDDNELLSSNYAFLGVTTDEDDKGARIESVTDESAAEKAGLKRGDIITKVGESTIGSPDQLTKAVRKHKPEEKTTITYLRDGKEQKASVTLGKRKTTTAYGQNFAPYIKPNFNLDFEGLGNVYTYNARPRLGVKAQDTEEGKGVKVIGIDNESIAEKAGLKEGDVITEFDGKTINDTDALSKAARDSKDKNSVTVKFDRGGKSQTAELKTPKKLKTTNL